MSKRKIINRDLGSAQSLEEILPEDSGWTAPEAEANGNEVLPLAEGGRGYAEESDLVKQLAASEEKRLSLEKELAEIKLALKRKKEECCLQDLLEVLEEHGCQLVPQPNGQFAVIAKE